MRTSKSMERAAQWVRDLMDHLEEMDSMDKRTAEAAMRLLRAGCSSTIHGGNQLWETHTTSYPDLDTGEALLHLSNRCAWNADKQRASIDGLCWPRETKS